MKTSTIDTTVGHAHLHRHRAEDRLATLPRLPRNAIHNHWKPNYVKTAVRSQKAIRRKASINSLWINRIGDRVVGMARLVQDGPHSARIVLFRIDPEWSHTKVPLNLIHSIQSFCQNHGKLKIIMQPHIVPPWMLTLMNQQGLQS